MLQGITNQDDGQSEFNWNGFGLGLAQNARTDADGAYEVLVNGPGSYHFSIGPEGGMNVGYGREVPDAREFALDFELPSARLTGIVRDAGGQPVAGIDVSLECAEPAESHRGWSPLQRLATGPTGAFAFERLEVDPGLAPRKTAGAPRSRRVGAPGATLTRASCAVK